MLSYEYDNSFTRILSFFEDNSDAFIPTLNSRVKLDEYAYKLATYGCNIFICLNNEDLGHTGFYTNDDKTRIAFLSSICVTKQYQGCDLSKQLLDRVLTHAASQQMTKLKLEVHTDNKQAISFYKKYGFEPSSRKSEATLIMKIDLNSCKIKQND